jgi:hypothetical protein
MKHKYTIEETNEILSSWKADPTQKTIDFLANKFNTTRRSVIAKLSYNGVYIKPKYVSKSGETPVSKSELVQELSELFTAAELEQLIKLNKTTIKKIIKYILY